MTHPLAAPARRPRWRAPGCRRTSSSPARRSRWTSGPTSVGMRVLGGLLDALAYGLGGGALLILAAPAALRPQRRPARRGAGGDVRRRHGHRPHGGRDAHAAAGRWASGPPAPASCATTAARCGCATRWSGRWPASGELWLTGRVGGGGAPRRSTGAASGWATCSPAPTPCACAAGVRPPNPLAMPPELAAWAAGADIRALPDGLGLAARTFLARDSMTPQRRAELGAPARRPGGAVRGAAPAVGHAAGALPHRGARGAPGPGVRRRAARARSASAPRRPRSVGCRSRSPADPRAHWW